MNRSRGIATIDPAALPMAVQIAAVEAMAEALARVPVDSGDLRDSIRLRPDGDGVSLVAHSRHAFYVEFGTADTEPQPFVRPAIRRAARRSLRRGLRSILRRA